MTEISIGDKASVQLSHQGEWIVLCVSDGVSCATVSLTPHQFTELVFNGEDLPLRWRGYARALAIVNDKHGTTNSASIQQCETYNECALELETALNPARVPQ